MSSATRLPPVTTRRGSPSQTEQHQRAESPAVSASRLPAIPSKLSKEERQEYLRKVLLAHERGESRARSRGTGATPTAGLTAFPSNDLVRQQTREAARQWAQLRRDEDASHQGHPATSRSLPPQGTLVTVGSAKRHGIGLRPKLHDLLMYASKPKKSPTKARSTSPPADGEKGGPSEPSPSSEQNQPVKAEEEEQSNAIGDDTNSVDGDPNGEASKVAGESNREEKEDHVSRLSNSSTARDERSSSKAGSSAVGATEEEKDDNDTTRPSSAAAASEQLMEQERTAAAVRIQRMYRTSQRRGAVDDSVASRDVARCRAAVAARLVRQSIEGTL